MERTDQWIESTQIVLYGHRSIVNQVRYNRQKCLLASSGVEKIVKVTLCFIKIYHKYFINSTFYIALESFCTKKLEWFLAGRGHLQ